jgi:DNA-binding MarR family transcriptional regulator
MGKKHSSKKDSSKTVEAVERDLRAIRQLLRWSGRKDTAGDDLTSPQRSVLEALSNSSPSSLKDLSAALGLAHSTVSGIADRLVSRGLLRRATNETDRRITSIALSKDGRERIESNKRDRVSNPLTDALAHAKAGEREAILDGVGILRRLLERSETEAKTR